LEPLPHCRLSPHGKTTLAVVDGCRQLAARPIAFVFVFLFVLAWLVLDRGTFNWHAMLSLATLCMTLFIQRSEHRDMQAVHAKLDELLLVHGEARNELTHLDENEPEQVEAFREHERPKS
jgi:low affinity Fe/Cu permease